MMPSLLDSGAIFKLKRAAGLLEEEPPQVRPITMGAPPGMMSLQGMAPRATPPMPDMPRRPSIWSRISDLGRPDLTPGMAAMLSPEEQSRATSGGGLLGRTATQLFGLGLFTPGLQARARASMMIGDKAAATAMRKQQTLEAGEQRVMGQFAPTGNESSDELNLKLRRLHAGLVAIGSPMADQLGNVIDDIQPQRPAAPLARQLKAVQLPDGTWTSIDEATGLDPQGQPVKGIVPRDPNAVRPQRQLATIEIDGKNVTGWANADAGTFTPIGAAKRTVSQDRANTAYRKAIAGIGQGERLLKNAVEMTEANPSAFGLINLLPPEVRERIPGRDNALDAATKGAVEAVVGELRHDRFGGAITRQEATLSIALFTKASSPAPVILAKLGELAKIVAAKKAGWQEAFETEGAPAGTSLTAPAQRALEMVRAGEATLADVESSATLTAAEKAAIRAAAGKP